MNLDFLENSTFENVKIPKIPNFWAAEKGQNGNFWDPKIAKTDFYVKSKRGSKILKFPHSAAQILREIRFHRMKKAKNIISQ